MATLLENFIREPFKTRYVHSDPSLLSLAIARKPDRLLSVAGYAPLDRCGQVHTNTRSFLQVDDQQDCLPHPACSDASWQLQAERKNLLAALIEHQN